MRLLLAVLALAGAFSSAASAHDHLGQPNWIYEGEYKAADGKLCCNANDCTQVDPDDVHEVKGGYSVRGMVSTGYGRQMTNFWVDEVVPQREVQPSRDGHYWRCTRPDGGRRCFFAPTPSL